MPLKPNTSAQVVFQPIPPGTYTSEIITAEASTSKAGEGMLVLEVAVNAFPDKAPITLKNWVMVEGRGSRSFDQLLRAVGLGDLADQYKQGTGPEFDEQALVGQRPNVVIKHEDFNGEMVAKIARFVSPAPVTA